MSLLDNYQCEGQMSIFDVFNQDTWCGKTSLEHSVQTTEKTSEPYLKKFAELKIKPPLFLCLVGGEDGVHQDVSWETVGPLLGEYTMHSFGECPNVENVSLLSQILEDHPHPKYCLSARACQGILNRAERRGKELPALLRETLMRQSASKSEQDVREEAKESLYSTNEQEPCQHSITNPSCLNPWDVQSKHIQPENGKAEALYSGECRYGGGESYVMQNTVFSIDEKMGQTYIGDDVGNTLAQRDYKQPQAVCISQDAYDKYTESDTSATIKQSGGNLGGGSESLVIQ